MAVILFYSPFYRRSRDVESLMIALKAKGHSVISLSQREGKDIHPVLSGAEISTYSFPLGENQNIWFFIRHIFFFVRFCKQHKIDLVFSHLDSANFVAAIGQFFIRAKVVLFRHHVDEAALYAYDRSFSYRLTNKLAKKIIVVSKRALDYMAENESVSRSKLAHINLSYDFALFDLPRPETIAALRTKFNNRLLLVTVSRLTKFKRPQLSIDVLEGLRSKSIDAHLVILGAGEMESELKTIIAQKHLQDFVTLTGHVQNALDYIGAADFVVHPSLLESSCVVVKEAGLTETPVVVCKGIGDFDEYIQDGINGFTVDPDRFAIEAAEKIALQMNDPHALATMGKNLKTDVWRLFDIRKNLKDYLELIE